MRIYWLFKKLFIYRQSCWSRFNILEVVSQKLHLLHVEDETDAAVKKMFHVTNLYLRRKSNRKLILRTSLYSFITIFTCCNNCVRKAYPFMLMCTHASLPIFTVAVMLGTQMITLFTKFMLNVRNVNLSVVLRRLLLWILQTAGAWKQNSCTCIASTKTLKWLL